MKVILLVLLIWMLSSNIKSLFRATTIKFEEVAEKDGKTIDKVKSDCCMAILITLFLVIGVYLWIAAAIDTPLIILGAAIAVLIDFRGVFKSIKMIKDGLFISKPEIFDVYGVVFKGYALYLLLGKMFGWKVWSI
ncbi:MAG TPA: hypothetical protein DCZ10_16060 [Pelotomaculum sp.]|nr:hypothetical protein [Pelotomaculum sp.]